MNTPIFVYVKEIDRMASAFDHADLAKAMGREGGSFHLGGAVVSDR